MNAATPTRDDFKKNRLLSTFPDVLIDQLCASATLVDLDDGSIVYGRGQHMDHSYFPLGPTTISVVVELDDKRSIEAVSIGNEGALGGIISCGHAPAFARKEVIAAGKAIKIPMDKLDAAKDESAHLRLIFCRFADFLIAEIMQSVACHSLHSIDRRAARWLVTAVDRAGPRVELTQGAFAALLGAQRTTINAVAQDLQEEGLIKIRRGAIEVIDVDGLKERACSCYKAVSDFFDEVIGESGMGAGDSDCV